MHNHTLAPRAYMAMAIIFVSVITNAALRQFCHNAYNPKRKVGNTMAKTRNATNKPATPPATPPAQPAAQRGQASAAPVPAPLGTMRTVPLAQLGLPKGLQLAPTLASVALVAPARPVGTGTNAHARSQRMPAYTGACLLVPLACTRHNVGQGAPAHCTGSNPKQAGSKSHAWYATGNAAFAAHGGACTVAQYMAYCAQHGRGVPVGAQIAWQVRAGMWALVPSAQSPAYPHVASK